MTEPEEDGGLRPYPVADYYCPECREMEPKLAALKTLVDEQAKDEGLWFFAVYSTEAYLQAELRRLHAVIEEATK